MSPCGTACLDRLLSFTRLHYHWDFIVSDKLKGGPIMSNSFSTGKHQLEAKAMAH
jgi:hypothetical protein